MRRLLVFVLFLGVVIVAIGFYRGWFTVAVQENEQTHKTDATLTVDKEKFREDKEKAKEKLKEMGQKGKDKAGELKEKVKN